MQPAQTIFEVDDPNSIVEIDSSIGEASPGHGITKQGLGTLILTGNNSYTGAVQINAGILSISNNMALGTADKAARNCWPWMRPA